ncbi:MAG: DUF3667 domain-containing protein [Marinoscillum sp.]
MSDLIQEVPTHCKNCAQPLYGDYCANCGQSARVRRITFRDTFNHFLSSAFAFEGPYLSTFRYLFKDPGGLFRDYSAGKRKQFYQPVAFFILNTAIYLIIRSLIDYNPFEAQSEKPDLSRMREMEIALYEAGQYMVAHINNILFVLVFATGLSFKTFFRKQFNLAEYVTYGFYLTGFYIILGIPVMLVSKYITTIPSQTNLLILCALLIYFSYSLIGRFTFLSVTKYILVTLSSILLYVIFGFGVSFLIVYLT